MENLANYYIKKLAQINKEAGVEKPAACVVTHGCQMNARDSEKFAGMLAQMGYELTKDEQVADLVIFNTCCVRENAENKLYGNLGNLKERKKNNPHFKIVLAGCMMQQDVVVDKIKESYNVVDIIIGTHNIYRFPELLHSHFETGGMIVDIWEEAKDIIEDLPSQREYPFKAGVNIMYGCDNFCTYCIVPHVRGRERSRKPEDILAEIKEMAADGVSEIMLLGQNVNSYDGGITFAQLLHKVHGIEGIKRIRFTSNHPKDITDDVIDALRDLPKVCKQLHLPFQAGSSRILDLMNRKHTKEWYLDLIERVKTQVPNIALTTDIMVGFPGETEEDFEDTLDIVRKVRFLSAFTFIYSRRHGTPADQMPDQVSNDVVKERFNRLVAECNKIQHELNEEKIGETLEILIEGVGKNNMLNGRADDGCLVHFEGYASQIGQYANVKITEAKTFYLIGEQL
ncbi:MAG: tRNA (N6-isopentenyl adenosine(37)-C2)-methylthiotransferase MiaB, partial [Defluviitaleaceae bacterium]|nr:tRNA (N6-isopentenyl adenosine(37)-C2)-methylthiotransferase MiaB [Defluviitaleaceae bacterium]